MTYKEKVVAIATKIMNTGGTDLFFKTGEFAMAFELTSHVKPEHLWLYEVTSNSIRFRKDMDSEVWEMPMDMFSESFCYTLYFTMKVRAHEQFAPQFYGELMRAAEETLND